MIVIKKLKFSISVKRTWNRSLSLIIVALVVSVIHAEVGFTHVAISSLPASILGVAIALLVSFRVNSVYERWWEACKIWGAIVNDSRTFAVRLLLFSHCNIQLLEQPRN